MVSLKKIFLCIYLVIFTFNLSASVEKIPVITLHYNNSSYLKDFCWQAKQYNPYIIFIGDDANNVYKEVDHFNINNFSIDSKKFESVYTHLCTNHFKYELFCFQRWFVLNEFMNYYNIDTCFHCDTDVMLYCNINMEYQNFSQYDLSIMISPKGTASGHISYWTKKCLQSFCDYIMNYYTDKTKLQNLKDIFERMQMKKLKGGICDMTLLTHFLHDQGSIWKSYNLRNIYGDAQFDHHMQCDEDYYEMVQDKSRNIKKITWDQDNFPYCFNKNLGVPIRFKALHFQGGTKDLMEQYRREKFQNLVFGK